MNLQIKVFPVIHTHKLKLSSFCRCRLWDVVLPQHVLWKEKEEESGYHLKKKTFSSIHGGAGG